MEQFTESRVVSIIRNVNRPAERTLILSDHRELGPYDASSLIACTVTIGCEFTEELSERLAVAEQLHVAKQFVMTYLSYAQRTEVEVRRYLTKKDVRNDIRDEVIAWLIEQKWINDAEIGVYLVQKAKQSGTKQSKNMLAAKMLRRGIARVVVTQLIQNEDYDEMPGARVVANKKWTELIRKQANNPRSLLVAYLSRKGFSHSTIRMVLNEINQND